MFLGVSHLLTNQHRCGNAVVPAPVNTVAPDVSIVTSGLVGTNVTTTNGTWDNSPTSYSYQWYRGVDAIGGATSQSYTITTADADVSLSCRVTASNAGGSTDADSSNNVTPAELHVPYYPANNPTTSYTEGVGLSFAIGNPANNPLQGYDPYANPPIITGTTYQWQYSTDDVTYSDMSGETSATLAEGSLTTGIYYRCKFTLTNAHGTSADIFTQLYQYP